MSLLRSRARLAALCAALILLFHGYDALRWTRAGILPTPTTDTVISMMSAQATPQIDVSSGVQITIIRNTRQFERGINIYCFISGYTEKSGKKILFSFCKNTNCYDVTDGTSPKSDNQYNFKASFETVNPGFKGLKISLQLTLPSNDYSGTFYCKAKNNNFEIRSNIIEIRDVIFWSLNLYNKIDPLSRTTVKMINMDSMPQVLNCSDGSSQLNPAAPRWTKIEFFSPTRWSVCPVFKRDQAVNTRTQMNFAKCLQFSKDKCDESIDTELCPLPVHSVPEWSTYVNQGGDLIFVDLRPQTSSRIDSYSLLCYTKDKDESFKSIFYFYDTIELSLEISKGITIDGITRPVSQPLTMVSPQVQEFVIYARQIPKEMLTNYVKPVAIYAFYKSSPDATFRWKLGDVELNSNNIMKVSKYMVTFPADVTFDQAGKYTLEVTDKSSKITMEVNVKVLGPPILVYEKCLIPLLYIKVGESTTFSCDYKQRPTNIRLEINGQDIKLSDSIDNSKANLKVSNPYLEMLSFTVTPTNFVEADTVTMSYSVFNLTKSLGQTQYQDHTVTFLATNDFGLSVKTSSIYVVPKLKTVVDYFPERDNCTNPCSSSYIHKFNCKVRVEEYDYKELIVDYYWTINSNKLGDPTPDPRNIFAPYFQVNPLTHELTMLPIKSNDTNNDKQVKDALANNYIECNINIRPVSATDSDFMYLSTSDKDLGNSMKAKITLDYMPINTAYIYWIVAIILGLILLIIIIVVLTMYCMKNRKETYQLDKKEREMGRDPDKEVQDEMFKPYERENRDHESVLENAERRLSLTGHSVGSNDDGELDNYELDESNFNEDGSIIGKYGANPRNRAGMT